MPIKVNKLRQLAVERSLRAGKSARQALKDAGYSDATVSHSTANKVVKSSIEKISKEFMETITPDNVIKSLLHLKKLAIEKNDLATATRCTELIGKYLKMFNSTDITVKHEPSQADLEAVEKGYTPRFTFIKPNEV